MSFGKRLLELRKAKKLSQDKLAKLLDVHGAVIGRYERDEVKPSIDMAKKIAEGLEISLDYLVGNTDLLLDKKVLERIILIQKLKEEDMVHLNVMIDAFLRDAQARRAYAS